MDSSLDLSKVMEDIDLSDVPSEEKLSRLNYLCQEQLKLEEAISKTEEALALLKEEHKKISEHEIPDLMDEIGLREFTLASGVRVYIDPFFTGDTKNPDSLKWLEENDHGDIIKGTLAVMYPKGYPQDMLRKIVEEAHLLGLTVDNKEEVHHSTLRGWIRDMVKSGAMFPRELFNVYVGRRTKFKIGRNGK